MEEKKKKLFDFCIGNPPYQISGTTNNKAEAIYPYFYDAAENCSNTYMLISPARFLFNAGLTKKMWNEKMLADNHINVTKYYANSSDVFPSTNINGGVCIIYRSNDKVFHPIEFFVPDPTLRGIADKFKDNQAQSIKPIVYGGRSDLKFNDHFLQDFPKTKAHILKTLQEKHPEIKALAPNEEYELKSSSFSRTSYAFVDENPSMLKIIMRFLETKIINVFGNG